MAFSFDTALTSNLDKVRFHIGDTEETGYYLHDATITALLSSEGGVHGAVIAGILYIIAKLSQPNFTADWLTVDNASARKSFEALLKQKRREFGLPLITAQSAHVYRLDSLQTEAPDYDEETT